MKRHDKSPLIEPSPSTTRPAEPSRPQTPSSRWDECNNEFQTDLNRILAGEEMPFSRWLKFTVDDDEDAKRDMRNCSDDEADDDDEKRKKRIRGKTDRYKPRRRPMSGSHSF